MLVGTAMTGHSTRPPTTLGRAPSIPATTTRASAFFKCGSWCKQPVQARDPDVGDERDVAVPGLGRHPRLLGDRQVAGPGRHDHHAAQLRSVVVRPADAKGSAQRRYARPGGRRVVDARPPAGRAASPALPVRAQAASSRSLRSARPSSPGRRRLPGNRTGPARCKSTLANSPASWYGWSWISLGRVAGRHAAVANSVEQLFQLVRIHRRLRFCVA